ncbi:MAG: DUF418 domain-containing protein [Tannerella sp.]|jgi:uncharacterized protein|nr:DUF418 domain-containing protein [Tannerella sp.]
MIQNTTINKDRLDIVDSLRGFALLAIVLLHNVEHYNLFYIPENMPEWLYSLDKVVWDTTFFLLAGKAYATFSLLFGFSFYIQFRNAQQQGYDYRARFAWRMFLLALFSQFHALFYNGDILLLYAVVGLVLIPVSKLKDRTVLILAVICLLQPLELIRIVYAFIDPEFTSYGHYFRKYARLAEPVVQNGNFYEVLRSNIWHGQLYSNLWQVENGRLFQTAALFMFGMLLGRKTYFVKSSESVRFWKKTLVYSIIAFIPLYVAKTYIPGIIESKVLKMPVNILLPSLANFAFMCFLVSGFTLLWFRSGGYKFQRLLTPYGRMTLTNYIGQSIMGVVIYYGYGLGLYKYTGATASILIATGIFCIQLLFSRWWLSAHRQGPLEYLWKKGTWIGVKKAVNDENNSKTP